MSAPATMASTPQQACAPICGRFPPAPSRKFISPAIPCRKQKAAAISASIITARLSVPKSGGFTKPPSQPSARGRPWSNGTMKSPTWGCCKPRPQRPKPSWTGRNRAMLSLAEFQFTLAADLLDGGMSAARLLPGDLGVVREALRIHRNPVMAGLANSLRLTYPTVVWLTGEDFFNQAALEFCGKHPPHAPCLSDYGSGFAAFLEDYEPA